MTNNQRKRRNFTYDESCVICNAISETSIHVVRDCDDARNMWMSLLPNEEKRRNSIILGDGDGDGFKDDLKVKLNTDEALVDGGKARGYGGVLRDFNRSWLGGFYEFLGQISIVESKLWGCLLGLRLACSKGLKHVWQETDSLLAVKMIKNGVGNWLGGVAAMKKDSCNAIDVVPIVCIDLLYADIRGGFVPRVVCL
ncbi:ribonuclease H [Senna tora]|uniref:Ribonuclease H n=1 Tax=Senna tora TaxID=362788 RepID=A0A835C5R2_9FABA|nr:ribonuclease H [Senna tora]